MLNHMTMIIYFYLIYIFDENNTQNLDALNTLTFNILIHRSFQSVEKNNTIILLIKIICDFDEIKAKIF